MPTMLLPFHRPSILSLIIRRSKRLTETEQAFHLGFVSMAETIIMAIRAMSYVVIAIMMAVVANTMVMSARDACRICALKALGFGYDRHHDAITT